MFSDATLYPVSLAHAWWLAEEKNSLKDWVPEKADALATDPANVARMLAEKDEALRRAEALRPLLETPPPGLRAEALRELADRIDVFIRYVRGFRAVGHALILARAALDRPGASEPVERALDDLLLEAESMQDFAERTDFPHVVYTLLSPERLRALHRDLTRRLGLGQAA